MTDTRELVERLRNFSDPVVGVSRGIEREPADKLFPVMRRELTGIARTTAEAADTIERLTNELREAREALARARNIIAAGCGDTP